MQTDTNKFARPEMPVTEDSGLHDIRALAKSTKQRISQRVSSVSDAEDSVIASSSAALRAVALPRPQSSPPVTLDDAPPAANVNLGPALSVSMPAAQPPRRSSLPMVFGVVAAAGVAVAAVMFLGNKAPAAQPPAMAPIVAPIEDKVAVAPAPSPVPVEAAITAAPVEPEMAAEVINGGKSDDKKAKGDDQADKRVEAKGDDKADKKAIDAMADHKAKGDKPDAEIDPIVAAVGAPAKPAAIKPGLDIPEGKKDIDDLLSEASGGVANDSKAAAADTAKPAKKELARDDIKSSMSAVQNKAEACYGKHGVSGTVGVKLVVGPNGKVTKSQATGSFAGTPTGDCVAAAAQNASFPSWDGAPMTVNYSYLLSE